MAPFMLDCFYYFRRGCACHQANRASRQLRQKHTGVNQAVSDVKDTFDAGHSHSVSRGMSTLIRRQPSP